MWVEAARRAYDAVQCVWGKLQFELDGKPKMTVGPLGTCTLLRKDALWITNAHVVLNPDGSLNDSLHVIAHAGQRVDSLRVDMHNVDRDADLALLKTPTTEWLEPLSLGGREPLPVGTPVATLGCPLPDFRILDASNARAKITRRLSAGFVSGTEVRHSFVQGTAERTFYELNLLSYAGNSGAPVLDQKGRLVGVNHATVLTGQTSAAFAIATRNAELFSWFEAHGVSLIWPAPDAA